MYKPQYLNMKRETNNVMGGNIPYWSKKTVTSLGYKKKPPEQAENKSGRRFAGRCR